MAKKIIRIRKSGWWMLQAFFRIPPWRAFAYIFLDKMFIDMNSESVQIVTYLTHGEIRSPDATALEEVADVEVDQGLLAIVLNYGTVRIKSSGGHSEGIVVKNPLRVKERVLKKKADSEIQSDVEMEAAHELAVEDAKKRLRSERRRE